jgi:amidophosphoribosyltransferase
MCGFIGIYGPDGSDVAIEIYEGLLAVQHRGQDAAGHHDLHRQVPRQEGPRARPRRLQRAQHGAPARPIGVGHVRYPTVGVGSDEDVQPFHMVFPIGIAMAHNGNVTNFLELKERLRSRACAWARPATSR